MQGWFNIISILLLSIVCIDQKEKNPIFSIDAEKAFNTIEQLFLILKT